MRRIILYFGSFNPIHKGHIAVAGYAARITGADVWLVVSPRNPLKDDDTLAPAADRLEMARIAVRNAADPHLEVCDIEFGLTQPSYTIDTLRALESRYPGVRFALLAGADIPGELDRWKEPEALRSGYDMLVYPRGGVAAVAEGRIEPLEGAPEYPYSSTAIREMLARGEDCADMLDAGVEEYIVRKGLYGRGGTGAAIASLDEAIAASPADAALYKERGRLYLQNNDFGNALNDFLRAAGIDPSDGEPVQYISMIREILDFRHTDLYNP